MATEPITRTIVWTGGRWVDQETGVYASALGAPTVSQSNDHHPFDKSFSVTYEQVQKMIADAFEQRVVDTARLHYFAPDDDKIITYVFHRTLMQAIQVFGERLNKVERPWWKRWFSR